MSRPLQIINHCGCIAMAFLAPHRRLARIPFHCSGIIRALNFAKSLFSSSFPPGYITASALPLLAPIAFFDLVESRLHRVFGLQRDRWLVLEKNTKVRCLRCPSIVFGLNQDEAMMVLAVVECRYNTWMSEGWTGPHASRLRAIEPWDTIPSRRSGGFDFNLSIFYYNK